jgi:hypothetical protein
MAEEMICTAQNRVRVEGSGAYSAMSDQAILVNNRPTSLHQQQLFTKPTQQLACGM